MIKVISLSNHEADIECGNAREFKVWAGSGRSGKNTIATVIKVGPDESKVWADDDDDSKMKGSESNRKASKYGLIKRT